jgi:selenocysteine lyase/cysteine desulfurase
LRPLYQIADQGVTHTLIGLDAQTGALAVDQLEQALQPNTKMVVCTHASNVTGYRLPIDQISAFCQRHQLLFVLDTSQTAGNTPIDMQAQGIDVLCFTGHKSLYGPQGTGGICFRKALPIEPLISGGSGVDSFNHHQPAFLPEALEAGTLNVPGIAGLAAGVQYCLDQGVTQLGQQAVKLADEFAAAMAELPLVTLYSHPEVDHVGTVALNVGDVNAAEISDLLTEHDIATRPGAHCAPVIHETLHTVEQGIVRFSFSSFNTQAETQAAIQTMQGIVALAKG